MIGDAPVNRAGQPAPEAMTRQIVADQLAENAGLSPDKALEIADLLTSLGHVIEGAPRATKIMADAQTFAERTILAELVVRLFRFYVLGSIVLPETPAAMDWLKSYVDGANGQGPLGAGPLLWPRFIPSANNLLRRWGFEPTPSEPPYVIKRREG